jgi:hypothetical protein
MAVASATNMGRRGQTRLAVRVMVCALVLLALGSSFASAAVELQSTTNTSAATQEITPQAYYFQCPCSNQWCNVLWHYCTCNVYYCSTLYCVCHNSAPNAANSYDASEASIQVTPP